MYHVPETTVATQSSWWTCAAIRVYAGRRASGRPLPRDDSSGGFFEMAEAKVLDHLRLDRREVLVGLVGTKRRAYDGGGSPAALGLAHELGAGLRDISG